MSAVLSSLVCLSLTLGPRAANAEAGPEPIEGPRPAEPDAEPPAPSLAPTLIRDDSPGIEFAVPPPEEEVEPTPRERPFAPTFPDPGMAPNDGVGMLTLSGTVLALTAAGVSAGLLIGLDRGTELKTLLPATIVPGVALLAFGGGGLYLGITRARAYRRWEIGNRVIGRPQGAGLRIGASFTVLGALGLIPAGALRLSVDPILGASLIGVGVASAIASPIMFVVSARRQRDYQRTGGWKRKPIPPLPPSAIGRLELRPMVVPLLEGGVIVGAGGLF